jgi:hypothetical protein
VGFWPSNAVLAAIDLGLFTALGARTLTAAAIDTLDLHPRPDAILLDRLAALGFLERVGDGEGTRYRNAAATGMFLAHLERLE